MSNVVFFIPFQRSAICISGKVFPLSEEESKIISRLVERRGQVVTKSELISLVWPSKMPKNPDWCITNKLWKIGKAFRNTPIFLKPIYAPKSSRWSAFSSQKVIGWTLLGDLHFLNEIPNGVCHACGRDLDPWVPIPEPQGDGP